MNADPSAQFDDGFLWYELPKDRIAQRPIGVGRGRANSRLLIAERCAASRSHIDAVFSALGEFLNRGDLLVLNDTKVLPWRFFARHGLHDGEIELLLLKRSSENSRVWQALAKPMKKLRAGHRLDLLSAEGVSLTSALVRGRAEEGGVLEIELDLPIEELRGIMPIPPYIRDGRADAEDEGSYQTTYAHREGSVAAPTAGLHFTPELFSELQSRGVAHAFVTLHLGPASFLPIRREMATHEMPGELLYVPAKTAERIRKTKTAGGRIIAVGTSTTRALESWAERIASREIVCAAPVQAEEYHETRLFIRPGFSFRVIDGLITNFHQPGSTHLLLVSALLGVERTAAAYQHALAERYRFLSYGDAMLIL